MRRRVRGGRVVDLACGHGLTAAIALLIDPSSEVALGVDTRIPASAGPLHASLAARWPRLGGRVALREADLASVSLEKWDSVVSVHACGALTDLVLARAIDARASVAVLPCCQDAETCDSGGLDAWMDVSLAIDSVRAMRLREARYTVHLTAIPSAISPKNRLLIGLPMR
ncbi:MAG: methyltransferase domain-containing protein [Polyangiaceae bacterium]|nr:methyltransferase domain-containing protein [Polyangiaceae bacterium]